MLFNGAQIHLAFNHLPVVLYPFILLTVIWAKCRRQESLMEFAYVMALIAGASAALAFFTGEGAEEILKTLPDYPKSLVHEHEETGEIAFIVSSVCAGLALLSLSFVQKFFVFLRSPKLQCGVRMAFIALVVSLSVLFAWVAHQGGVVRHSEIRVQ